MTHKTKGIILRTVKFGETSVVVTAYTELFGIQSYMVKGVRQDNKKSSGKGIYFQPAAILDMEVYHNQQRNLNFIKEYNWGYLYENVLSDVVKNTVALYMIELLHRSLKQPEANPELFHIIHDSLLQLDKASPTLTANLPLYFSLHLAGELGFKIQGTFSEATPVLDLQEGQFISGRPNHSFYAENELAQAASQLQSIHFYSDLEGLYFSRATRQQLQIVFQNYIALHVHDFGEMKTLSVLQQIFE